MFRKAGSEQILEKALSKVVDRHTNRRLVR